jgi:hypothetical protein
VFKPRTSRDKGPSARSSSVPSRYNRLLRLHRLHFEEVPWDRLDAFADRVVFQTREWLSFIAETQRAEPVVAELREGSTPVGYFSGLIFRKFGVRILGSSFPGWTTPYIGFNLPDEFPRWRAVEALRTFAFRELGCWHFEVSDRRLTPEDGQRLGLDATAYESYATDLTLSEDSIFKNMDSACRRCIRKAEKSGVTIEEASPTEEFSKEYYEQLKDVFAKQGKVPTYGLDRVLSLVRHVGSSGNLLLLRAIGPEGNCIGTGIYPGFRDVAFFWGNASWRKDQQWRPNETLHWYAMRYWKARGVTVFDWGGGGEYKEKYGVVPIAVPWLYKSRYKALTIARNELRNLFYRSQRLLGRLHGVQPGARPASEAGQ